MKKHICNQTYKDCLADFSISKVSIKKRHCSVAHIRLHEWKLTGKKLNNIKK